MRTLLLTLFLPLFLSACEVAYETTEAEAATEAAVERVIETAPDADAETSEVAEAAPLDPTARVEKTEEEWRELLTEAEFYVTREEGTERAFSGRYWDNKTGGTYGCVCCGADLFASATKFRSGTGWPSFFEPLETAPIGSATDYKIGYARTEVECGRCDAHLGHVFEDGPEPTGLRYCINGTALIFRADAEADSAE